MELRVMHLTAGSDAGGISRYLLELCPRLRAQGVEPTIVGQPGAWHRRFTPDVAPWFDAPLSGGPLALRRAAKQVDQLLDAQPADLLHVHYRKAARAARLVARRRKLPILFTLHLTDVPFWGPYRWLSDFGDFAHAPSVAAQRWLTDVAGLPAERVALVPHGVDIEKFPMRSAEDRQIARTGLGLPADRLIAAYVGRLDNPKNADWLLDAAAEARKRSLPALFVLAGDGPHRTRLEQRVKAEQLREYVRLLGDLDPPTHLYHAADLFLLPSAREGFSLACAEAMSAGCPVLRTRTAGCEEQIIEGETGRSVPVDRQTFIDQTLAMLAEPAALTPMGEKAAAHVRHRLTLDRQVEQTVAMYRRVVAGYDGGR